MRVAVLALLLLLAGCAGGPQALGITGPQGESAKPQPPPGAEAAPVDPLDNPDIMQSGGRYGPGYVPTTGGGSFWGYN